MGMTGVVVLIRDRDGRVLARRRGLGLDEHKYGAPGGKPRHGETVLETALRECEEETGARLLHPSIQGHVEVDQWIVWVVAGLLFGEEQHIEPHHGPWEWVSPDDLNEDNCQSGLLRWLRGG